MVGNNVLNSTVLVYLCSMCYMVKFLFEGTLNVVIVCTCGMLQLWLDKVSKIFSYSVQIVQQAGQHMHIITRGVIF